MSDRNRQPHLQVIKETWGPNSDPHLLTPMWNREWTAGEHGGCAFTTEMARVDVVNPQQPDNSGSSLAAAAPSVIASSLS